ncbi:MAG: right-handed parallel beta-helix repeat-containing protein [Planctomycetota bacterium]|nr:right-handed parallel beta-helix repeat-containing protein [Planctomycetota bacterium]
MSSRTIPIALLLLTMAAPLPAATIRVPGDHASIQAAIDAALPGDTVLVAPGEYVISEPLTFGGKDIALRAEAGAEETTIRMAETPADPGRASVVVFENGEGESAELRGFTITGGRGTSTAEPGGDAGLAGGGILFRHGSSPTVALCAVVENSARLGGGVYCGTGSSPRLVGCAISRNTGGGIWCLTSSSPAIEECTISENRSQQKKLPELELYPGVYVSGSSSPTITDCVISRNEVGGIWCLFGAAPVITGCAITDNTGGGVWCMFGAAPTLRECRISGNVNLHFGSGVICIFASPVLQGCEISGNQGGAGLYCESASPELVDCTIAGNAQVFDGGGIYCERSSPTLTNCVIRDNSTRGLGGGLYCEGPSFPAFDHCTISGNEALAGGGIYAEGAAAARVESCIIWNNVGGSIDGQAANAVPEVNFSCVEAPQVWPGFANIDFDPLFCGWRGGEEVYVDSASLGPGDGSEAAPYPDLGPALEYSLALSRESPCLGSGEGGSDMGADAGGCDGPGSGSRVVRVAAGAYRSAGRSLAHGASIEGAGAAETLLEGGVFGLRDGAALARVTVTGSPVGGIVIAPGQAPRILECAVSGNMAGGIYCGEGSSPTISRSKIVGNFTPDAPSHIHLPNANAGGGVHCASRSAPSLINCLIAGNQARGWGGGVYLARSSVLDLTSSTVAGNRARVGGGIYLSDGSEAAIRSTIVWGNDGGGVFPGETSRGEVNASFSCLEGEPFPGEGNITEDPLFAAPGSFDFGRFTRLAVLGGQDELAFPDFVMDAGDYRLGPGSPARDAGASAGLPGTDIDGDDRPCGAGVDMGAYESCGEDPTAARFRRGDANADARTNLSDAVFVVAHLFRGGREPPCGKAADVDDTGRIDITDAVYTLNWLFLGGSEPPLPGPAECGVDPTEDDLGCASYPGCAG